MANANYLYSPHLEYGSSLPNIKSMNDGTPYIVRKTNGNKDFYYSFLGEWTKMNITSDDELRVKKLGIGLATTDAITYDLTLKNGGQFGNPAYSAGSYKFDGTGYLLDYDNKFAGKSYLEIDNLLVRGNLTVYDFLVIQKRFTNGSLFISNGAKVKSVNSTTITFEDASSTGLCPFVANDLVLTLRYKPDGTTILRNVEATVSSVSGNTAVVSYTTGTFQTGDEVVRIGNTTDTARQGMVYLTADDTNAPYIDIVTGVNSWAAWASNNKVVGRFGRLKDFPTTAFGSTVLPDVVGLYIKNNIYMEDGYIAMGTNGYIRGGLTSYGDTSHAGFWLGYNASGTAGYKFRIFNSATKYLDYDGTDINFVGGKFATGSVASSLTMTYDRGVAGTEFGYWLGKYGTNDYRFYMGSSATKYFKYDNTDLSMVGGTITGGTLQTATGTDQRIVIQGSDNTLRFYNSSNANVFSIVGNAFGGIAGLLLSSGVIYNSDGTNSTYSSPSELNITNAASASNGTSMTILTTKTGAGATYGIVDVTQGQGTETYGLRTVASGGTIVYALYADAGSGTTNWAGYFDGGNVYIKNELQIGANKFNINSSGQITKVNNLAASSYTNYYLGSDGTSFTPRQISLGSESELYILYLASGDDLSVRGRTLTLNGTTYQIITNINVA